MKTYLFALLSLFACLVARADEARPWTFWYWMNGAVTREGITADLEAMANAGLGGCYLMPIYDVDKAPELGGTLHQGTKEWWQMVDYSLREADRLGLKIGMHICDGFALAGGPWITPAQSMQMVVSTDTVINITQKRGLLFDPNILPAPQEGYYRDIAAYAIPLQYQPVSSRTLPKIESTNPDFTIDKKGRIKCPTPCTFTLTYDKPVTVSALRITTYNNSIQALRMHVSYVPEDSIASDNSQPLPPDKQGLGVGLCQLVPPRHGWQNYDQPTTVAIPTVTTRQLIFKWTPEGTEKGSEDLDNAKWGKNLKIERLEVLAEPRINDWEGKSGRIWRISSSEQDATSPGMYVPLDKVINLVPGTTLPMGDWRIIRIGHTSTRHMNDTGGDCRGLECDKFSRSAIQLQLDHWFAEAFRQCDDATAKRVLKYMHVDSWECASQNWSDSISLPSLAEGQGRRVSFADYFEATRGYSLLPYLPLMVGIPIEDMETSERVLREVRNTIAQLVDEAFFPTLAEKAKELDCQLSAECTAPTMVADGMAHYKHVDLPMGEFWINSPTHDKPNDMLDAISGAHIYGKQIIQAEGFTELRGSFDKAPAQLKALLDKLFCMGMNRLVFHVFTHNPDPSRRPGMTLNGIGTFFQPTQPWWPEAGSFVDYITRCQRLLQMGRPVVDLAVYTGHEMPRRAILPERLEPLAGYHYDSFNYDALIKTTQTHEPSNPFPQYKALLLPGTRKLDPDHQPLPQDALDAIGQLKQSGIKVIEGKVNGPQLNTLGIAPDAKLPEGVLFAHRSLPEAEIYFFSNQQDKTRSIYAWIRDHRQKPAVQYDPVSDTYHPVQYAIDEDSLATMTIDLPADGSCFILFGMTAGTLRKKTESASIELYPTTTYDLHFEENGITLSSDTLIDWAQSANDSIRYYSGRVHYSFDFKYKPFQKIFNDYVIQINGVKVPIPLRRKADGHIYLRFTDLHDAATISLNGHPCGSVWTSPYEVDITNAIVKGTNHLDIWVANTWNNAIIGHDSGHAPFPNIWTNAKNRPKEPKLLPAGLGPIKIIFREK